MTKTDITPITDFLKTRTPQAWIDKAVENIPILLIDHANCEKKAASTAMSLLYRYCERHLLCKRMSRLAREELRHFEQVSEIMHKRGIEHEYLSPSRYGIGLHQHSTKDEPQRLIDILIIGAIIEARSCERFAVLAPHLDAELQDFYLSLLKSEARHFQQYLEFAQEFATADINPRVEELLAVEADLIDSPDSEFRFHSGCPG